MSDVHKRLIMSWKDFPIINDNPTSLFLDAANRIKELEEALEYASVLLERSAIPFDAACLKLREVLKNDSSKES